MHCSFHRSERTGPVHDVWWWCSFESMPRPRRCGAPGEWTKSISNAEDSQQQTLFIVPSGDIRKNWNNTEKISMAPAQGWHAFQSGCSSEHNIYCLFVKNFSSVAFSIFFSHPDNTDQLTNFQSHEFPFVPLLRACSPLWGSAAPANARARFSWLRSVGKAENHSILKN